MKTTELLAIEVKQYVDDNGQHQTIVPRVIGATSEKEPSRRRLTREKLLEAIGDHPEAAPHAADGAEALLDWAQSKGLRVRYRDASAAIASRSPQRTLLRVSRRGNIRVELRTLRKHGEPWNDDSIRQLRRELELGPTGDSPKAPPGSLTDKNRREKFFKKMEEVVGTLTVEGAANDPSAPQPP